MFRNKLLSMVLLAGMLISQSIPQALAAGECDRVQFVSDLTAPDGSAFVPGAAFTKTWRLMNTGTCTWTTAYNLVWVGGDALGAPSAVRLPVDVAPGQMVDISVNLAAPATSGHYKALFKISNTTGSQFGIGDAAGDPFWADINVVNINAVIYDFVANASYAQWKSGAGVLPFPGASGDGRGYSYTVNNPHLEDDSYDPAPGLLVVPQNKFNGYIQATYPEFQVQSGDRLQTLVNCEFGATGCYVTFRVDYLLPNGVQKTFWTFKESYDKRFYRANLDLSPLAGQKVRFVFMVLSSGFASGDRALWGAPRIVRAGTGQPPAPPATLTPLPPLPPTATPLIPPPPTIQPAGCDKASFVTDVTVQDGTSFAPGATFTKTWRLRNAGTCIWTTAYKLVYYSGDPMSAPTTVNLPWSAAWGQTVDVSVNMVAPTTPGKYRGYWILANASGQFFGIGANAANPIWVEINVSGEPTFEGGYHFWLNACSAEWRSGAGPLPCPGTEGDRKGFIIPLQYSHLEDGNKGPLPTLLMSPENKYNGYIQGIFPAFTVQPRDHFVTVAGCEYGYPCYVTFRLDYMTPNGGIFNFWSWREQNDKKNYMASVDLTPLAGRSVRFILTILATGSPTGDRVRWGGPAIVRVEGGTPPTLTPSPTSTSTPVPPPVVSSPLIKKLFMNDPSNGWAIGKDYVLKTSDGGGTWYNISPPGLLSIVNGFFQNPGKGWVLAKRQDSEPDVSANTLFRTTDGGLTWTVYNNQPFSEGTIKFLDDMNGFVMSGLPSGMHKHAVQIYQTSDGGATWALKYANDPSQPNNTLPFGGLKYGMTFRNTTTGWVGGYSPEQGSVYLYKTTNGGVTWAQQSLALPAGYETADFSTTAPTFFGPNDAVLPVWMTTSAGRDLYIYATHDGGATWSRSASFARNGAFIDFASWKDVFGYAWSDVFHVTNDAGATWRTVTPNVRFSELAYQTLDMDFISATTGWFTIGHQDGSTSLYRTTDGGATWTRLFGSAPTATDTPSPQLLPDLTIGGMHIQLQNPSCLMPGDPLGVRIGITNNGQTVAGSFVVRVNDVDQTVNRLGIGETTVLFFPSYRHPVDAIVDATNTVAESDESNNSRSEMVPVPTPPLPCPTPTFAPPPPSAAEFAQTIVSKLNARSFDALPAVMEETFSFGYWQSQGNTYPSDEAIDSLRTSLTVTLVPNANQDLNALLGGLNPYSIMGLDPSRSYGLFVSGWGSDPKAEAILYVTQRADGSLYWHSVLIAPTKFINDPSTLSGPYAVVRVAANDVLNIRAGAGVSHPVVGSFPFGAVSAMRTGPTASADNATWWQVQNPNGGTGWVNSYYLTEYVSHEAFCADARLPSLIDQLKGSMNQSNGDMFAGLVSPVHGADVRLWAYGTDVKNYSVTTARSIFTSPEVFQWGSGPVGGTEYGLGTFPQIIQPKLLEVLNAPNMETYCDDLTNAFPLPHAWPYSNIRYYNLYKPAKTEFDFDYRTWLIGIEYINGQPYLYAMVSIVWEP